MYWQHYLRAESVEDALKGLSEYEGRARLIAGGTDLVEQIRNREKQPVCLIDISRNPEIGGIRTQGGKLVIGAAVTHARIVNSTEVRRDAPMLAEACAHIGSVQIRNIGTVGGNIVNSQPAADAVMALSALNAELTVVSSSGQRKVPLQDVFLGPGKCAIDSTKEVLTGVSFQKVEHKEACAFGRLARRKGATLPTLNAAVRLSLDREAGHIERIRLFMGPVAPTPKRLVATERILMSGPMSDQLLKDALETVKEEVNPRDSLRGSADYRRAMCPILVKRCLIRALNEAGWKK